MKRTKQILSVLMAGAMILSLTACGQHPAPFGVEYIETRMEAVIGGYAAACVAAEYYGEYDGVVDAAFGDPGLLGLKELLDVPVVGMTEGA